MKYINVYVEVYTKLAGINLTDKTTSWLSNAVAVRTTQKTHGIGTLYCLGRPKYAN